MLEQLKMFMSALTTQDYVTFGLGVVIIILLFIFKETKTVMNVVGKAIVDAETKLNGEEGQKRLDYAIAQVQNNLPVFVKPFVTKYLIVTLIENMLNFMNGAFKIERKVDIKGNEE